MIRNYRNMPPRRGLKIVWAGETTNMLLLWSSPKRYVKDQNVFFTRFTTLHVAGIGDFTMGAGGYIVSDYLNRMLMVDDR